jgi:hypothetical protein
MTATSWILRLSRSDDRVVFSWRWSEEAVGRLKLRVRRSIFLIPSGTYILSASSLKRSSDILEVRAKK